MSDSAGADLSEWLEGARPARFARRARPGKPRRPSYRWFGIRYSAVGGEYKSYCYQCEYESSYGTRGRAVKCAAAHVTAKHEVDGSEER